MNTITKSKDPQTQVARIKQTIEKVLNKDASLAEQIRTCGQVITIVSILTALSMTISTTVLAMTCAFRGGGEEPAASGSSLSKDEGNLKKLLNRPAHALNRLTGKTV